MAGVLDGIDGIYDGPEALAKATGPVVCILDTEHPDRIKEELAKISNEAQPGAAVPHASFRLYKCRLLKDKVEKITGLPCILLHYSQVTRKDMANPNIKAMFISARRRMISQELDEEFFALIRETKIPTIGACGGHEMIVQACGGKVGKMRDLKPGEKDPNPNYWPGVLKEWGFQKIKVIKRDPLFAGLPDEPVVREFHSWEVKELPAEFEILAETDECKIEAVKHKGKLLYGTQFHLELYDEEHPDGRTMLENFFKIAGVRVNGK
jgi:GMP synthase (glutamine-hydrolysing)